jgi:Hsp70 protein
MNADEAVARGCALQCAILSSKFKVKDFSIIEAVPYPIRVSWEPEAGAAAATAADAKGETVVQNAMLELCAVTCCMRCCLMMFMQQLAHSCMYTTALLSSRPHVSSHMVYTKGQMNKHSVSQPLAL